MKPSELIAGKMYLCGDNTVLTFLGGVELNPEVYVFSPRSTTARPVVLTTSRDKFELEGLRELVEFGVREYISYVPGWKIAAQVAVPVKGRPVVIGQTKTKEGDYED